MSEKHSAEGRRERLPRPSFTPMQTIAIVVRQLIPVIGVFVLGWSAGQFVLLSVFNICFSIVCIGVVGVLVSSRQEVGPSPNRADAISSLLTAIGLAIVGSVLLTAMFGWVVALFMVSAGDGLFETSLWMSALAMVISATPALVRQYQSDLSAGLDEATRKRRDQPNVLSLVLSAGLIFIASGYAGDFGRSGLSILAVLVTALFLFRDLRPDLMRELVRPSTVQRSRKSS
jgi:hypothetical protein